MFNKALQRLPYQYIEDTDRLADSYSEKERR